MQIQSPCLVSACLVGLCTRYDGRSKPCSACMKALSGLHFVPICPEQLGGLPTPRPPAMLWGGDGFAVLDNRARVLDIQGRDLSAAFLLGADMTLALARMQGITRAFLKSGSPSCGTGASPGVTAALLIREGLQVVSF